MWQPRTAIAVINRAKCAQKAPRTVGFLSHAALQGAGEVMTGLMMGGTGGAQSCSPFSHEALSPSIPEVSKTSLGLAQGPAILTLKLLATHPVGLAPPPLPVAPPHVWAQPLGGHAATVSTIGSADESGHNRQWGSGWVVIASPASGCTRCKSRPTHWGWCKSGKFRASVHVC